MSCWLFQPLLFFQLRLGWGCCFSPLSFYQKITNRIMEQRNLSFKLITSENHLENILPLERFSTIYQSSIPDTLKEDFYQIVTRLHADEPKVFIVLAWNFDIPVGLAVYDYFERCNGLMLSAIAVEESWRESGIGNDLYKVGLKLVLSRLHYKGFDPSVLFFEVARSENPRLRAKQADLRLFNSVGGKIIPINHLHPVFDEKNDIGKKCICIAGFDYDGINLFTKERYFYPIPIIMNLIQAHLQRLGKEDWFEKKCRVWWRRMDYDNNGFCKLKNIF